MSLQSPDNCRRFSRYSDSDTESETTSVLEDGYTTDSTFATSIRQNDAGNVSDTHIDETCSPVNTQVPPADTNGDDVESGEGPHYECDVCKETPADVCCFMCNKGLPYHKACWEMERLHKPGRKPIHQQSPINYLSRLLYFNKPNEQTKIDDSSLQQDDLNCFVEYDTRDERAKYRLGCRAFPLLPHRHDHGDQDQYPSFISFVGRTANGKSFLIRALQRNGQPTPIPAPGADERNHHSTSGDIHLYADSLTSRDEAPILFLDCEGFEGSDLPKGVRTRMDNNAAKERRAHVEVAYPRFVYAFSTCIVFVTSGSLVESADMQRRLISYATQGAKGSKNQGFKPSLFLVFNKFSGGKQQDFDWSIASSTKAFLASGDVQELRNYYSNIRVIYIPSMDDVRAGIALEQLDAFERALREGHKTAFRQRRRFHLDFMPRQLQPFLQKALKHFSNKPNVPFDWAVEAPPINIVQSDWEVTLIDLWTQYLRYRSSSETSDIPYNDVRDDFERHVTFCLRLVLSRNPPHGWLLTDVLDKAWAPQLKQLREYIPCGATSPDGLKCEKVRLRHGEYHECLTNRCATLTRWAGEYKPCDYGPSQSFEDTFRKIVTSLGPSEKISSLHDLTPGTIPKDIQSISTCLGCLQGPPSTILACGHAFCPDCVQELTSNHHTPHHCQVIQCPIHREPQAYSPRILPNRAGYRILSLDGGGVKGLAQLVMLREIEKRCFEIPVIYLFDLVVGTSVGGQIALALNTETPVPLTVAEATDKFQTMMQTSFKRKKILPFTVVSMIADGTKYKAKVVELQLKTLFGEKTKLFSAATSLRSNVPNVAVTTVAVNPYQSYLISNYNRKPLGDALPLLFGPSNDCMPLWAAARCTSAALPFFKPLEWQGQTLLDGGFKLNCPAACAYSEGRSIWPNRHCDILLSLGTGRALQPRQATRRPKFFHVVEAVVNDLTDADGAWGTFSSTLEEKEGIFRINPEYSGPGFELDEFRELKEIKTQTAQWLANQHSELNDICDRLIAALFFFHLSDTIEEGVKGGEILCRLPIGLEGRQNLVKRMCQVGKDIDFFEVEYGAKDPVYINVVKTLQDFRPEDELQFHVKLPDLPSSGGVKIHVKMRRFSTIQPHVWLPISGSPYEI